MGFRLVENRCDASQHLGVQRRGSALRTAFDLRGIGIGHVRRRKIVLCRFPLPLDARLERSRLEYVGIVEIIVLAQRAHLLDKARNGESDNDEPCRDDAAENDGGNGLPEQRESRPRDPCADVAAACRKGFFGEQSHRVTLGSWREKG